MGTPPPHPTQTRSHLSGGSSRSRAMVQCGLPPLILPFILIIAPSNTQGIPGCNSLLCQLLAEQLAEQGQLPELYTFSDPPAPHKRVPGMEFFGKRAPGMEFLGKRAPGMEFLGKRAPGMEFVGKRAPGMEFLGKRSGNTQSLHRNRLYMPEVLGLDLE